MTKEAQTKTEEKVGKQKIKHESIWGALSALQGELEPLEKSAQVKFKTKNGMEVDYSYTPLGDIMEEIGPLLAKNGLSARHELVKIEGKDYLEAVITHETAKRENVVIEESVVNGVLVKKYKSIIDGELRSGPVRIYQGDDMKDIGSAITYARRYSLTMALGISSEEDMDAKLFMERAENAIDFAYKKALGGIETAKTSESLDKALKVLREDLKQVENGKAGALGLNKEQYNTLIEKGEDKKVEIERIKPE